MAKIVLKPIVKIAERLGIPSRFLEPYGHYKAKIDLALLKAVRRKKRAKYVVVTGITPTPLGEGKTVTTIGLSMALNRIGHKAAACIRQPSLGPFFGVKGGGVGGGRSKVLPEDDINLFLTGDIHAVSQAHNLCASFLDNHLFRGNALGIDPERIYWRRAMDVNDRALRRIRIALGGGENGYERETGFDITAASELMAIIALADSVGDLRERVGRVVVAMTKGRRPVTATDLKAAGAMALLLRDALKPTLVQTSEGTPCFIHTGPFANITHGNSSIIADRMGLSLADYVVTESGFGADCGFEKFADIKCRQSGIDPDVAVLVASVRALKVHSGKYRVVPGRPLDKALLRENLDHLEMGLVNLEKQIENIRLFGLPAVVVINRFDTDTDREIEMVRRTALRHGAFECVVSRIFKLGSAGGDALARAVEHAGRATTSFRPLYDAASPIKQKIETIAKKVYGAKGVHYDKAAEDDIALYQKLGYGKLPICMAKTHLSLSHDPQLKGAPTDFILPVRDLRPSIGAGFLYVLCGKVVTMPSLPAMPAGERYDIDAKGNAVGV